MRLIFQRTGERRYAIRAQRPGLTDVIAGGPGYDPLVPHDLLHLVVEAELGITDGIFGQLAAGGNAVTFYPVSDGAIPRRAASRARRRANKRGEKLNRKGKDDSLQSERATYICWYEWLARSAQAERRKQAMAMRVNASHIRSTAPRDEVCRIDEALTTICRHLDELSARWSRLRVGESIAVRWPDLTVLAQNLGLQDRDWNAGEPAVATDR